MVFIHAPGPDNQTARTGRRRSDGFSLIELMIAVVILGILASIALPSYNKYIQKGRRADAKAALVELAQSLERHFTLNNSYASATLDTGVTARLAGYYSIGFAAGSPTATSYTIQAAPVSGSSQASDSCGTLAVTNTGSKTASASGCWN